MYLHRYPLGLMVFILSLFCSCELGKDTEKKAREAQEENRRKQERSIEYEQALLEYRELRAKNERIDQEMQALEKKKASFSESDWKKLAKPFEGIESAVVSSGVAYLHSGPDESLMNMDEYLKEGVRCTLLSIEKGFAKVSYPGKKGNQDRWIKLRDLHSEAIERDANEYK